MNSRTRTDRIASDGNWLTTSYHHFFRTFPSRKMLDFAACFISTRLTKLVVIAGFWVCGPHFAVRDPWKRHHERITFFAPCSSAP
jgi:hypothetical protein